MQKTMPDIANTAAALQTGKLDWVGMGDIELPFIFESLDLAPTVACLPGVALQREHPLGPLSSWQS
mgnify:CR=1 FL=1